MLDGDSDQGKPALGWFVLGMIVGNLVMYAVEEQRVSWRDKKTSHMEDTCHQAAIECTEAAQYAKGLK